MTREVGVTGFGLAQVKTEGMSLSLSHPEVPSWNGYTEERENYIQNEFREWYWKPFRKFLRGTMSEGWNSALFENAKQKGDSGCEKS